MSVSRDERRLYRTMRASCENYALVAPGDHIMVAMSGGKDSYALFVLLLHLQSRLPFELRLTAVHLDQRQPDYDGTPLVEYLRESGADYQILSEDTYSIVVDHVEVGGTYCSMCSRLRRGILYTAAERLGCNKIALGHHRDDALETFLLNLFYAGKLQAMPAKYRTDDGRFEVIRPLIECDEGSLVRFSEEKAFPILPCNLCGSQDGLKRDKMTALLGELEQNHPHLRAVMLNALQNVRPSHLLDRDVGRAWEERDPSIRPDKAGKAAEPRARALPTEGRMHLPVVGDR